MVRFDSWIFFFFNDTATTEIYTLSLHDALPILRQCRAHRAQAAAGEHPRQQECLEQPPRPPTRGCIPTPHADRKSTRLNSSHSQISYAVFCLKKKKLNDPASISIAQNYLSMTTN